jgi:hypothetical protein
VAFPDHVKSHTREHISCFGPDGLLRREGYTVDILGDYQLVPEPLLVAIDIGEITVC